MFNLIITSVLISAFVSGIFLLVNGFFNRKYNRKKDLMTLALNMVKHKDSICIETSKLSGDEYTLYPIEEMTIKYYEWLNERLKE